MVPVQGDSGTFVFGVRRTKMLTAVVLFCVCV